LYGVYLDFKSMFMKRVLFLSLFAAAVTTASAQSLTLADTVTEVSGVSTNQADDELDAHWGVTNSSSSEINVRVYREVFEHPTPWNNPYTFGADGFIERFCWGPICYGYGTAQSGTNASLIVTMQPGETNESFHGYYEHHGVPGAARIRYCFFDNDNPANETCQEVIFCIDAACTVGVDEKPEFSLGDIAPNPIQGVASFSYSFPNNAQGRQVVVYNMVGAKVKEIALNNPSGLVFINADEFGAGVYFYTLVDNSGVHATRKFVVSK
jgi:hypothetical protein